MRSFPVALTIAGSDSSAGAGLQADLKAFTAAGVYGLTVATCVVAERPGKVISTVVLPVDSIRDQLRAILEVYPVGAIKTGLLPTAEVIDAVRDALRGCDAPLVIDPVAIASTGTRLVSPDAREPLIALARWRASLITPNRAEAESFLGAPIQWDTDGVAEALQLREMFGCDVLLKGGHFRGDDAIDWLVRGQDVSEIRRPRIPDLDVHGTGCAYSAAIAAGLAKGYSLTGAVSAARSYLHSALEQHWSWTGPGGEEIKALAPNPKA
jgi:hydroxymethylpyrimidine/phosphomethylpyrimidine kinase